MKMRNHDNTYYNNVRRRFGHNDKTKTSKDDLERKQICQFLKGNKPSFRRFTEKEN